MTYISVSWKEAFIRAFNTMSFKHMLTHFTTINIILLIFIRYTEKVFDIFLSTLSVAVLSTWIVAVYPKVMIVPNPDNAGKKDNNGDVHILERSDMIYCHLIFHIAPLVFVIAYGLRPQVNYKTFITIVTFLLYFIFSDIQYVYGLKQDVAFVLLGLMVVLYMLFVELEK